MPEAIAQVVEEAERPADKGQLAGQAVKMPS